MQRVVRVLFVASVAAMLVQCDLLGPDGPFLELQFCPGDVPVFVAVQPKGGAWRSVQVNSELRAIALVGEKAGVALTRGAPGGYSTTVMYGLVTELNRTQSANFCPQQPDPRFRIWKVTVAGVGAGQLAKVYTGSGAQELTNGAKQVYAPLRRVDLIAELTGNPPHKFIIRRDVDLDSGATIPALDFASSEAVASELMTITPDVGGSAFGRLSFAGGAQLNRSEVAGPVGSATYETLPASLTLDGDVNILSVNNIVGMSSRHVIDHHRLPGTRAVTMGPTLPTPVFDIVAASPMRRRCSFASQPEYSETAICWFFHQGAGTIAVVMTRAYLGETPAMWALEVPDVRAAAGYPAGAYSLQGAFEWTIYAMSARLPWFFEYTALDGDVIRVATLNSSNTGHPLYQPPRP